MLAIIIIAISVTATAAALMINKPWAEDTLEGVVIGFSKLGLQIGKSDSGVIPGQSFSGVQIGNDNNQTGGVVIEDE